jgi:hypothetical protein
MMLGYVWRRRSLDKLVWYVVENCRSRAEKRVVMLNTLIEIL